MQMKNCDRGFNLPGIQEDEFEVKTGPEHKHVVEHFDFSDSARWQRMSDGHKSHVLVTTIIWRNVHRVLFDLQVAATVYHLQHVS